MHETRTLEKVIDIKRESIQVMKKLRQGKGRVVKKYKDNEILKTEIKALQKKVEDLENKVK